MDSSIITVLAIILLILIILNNITIISPIKATEASCSQTAFGCCPNGVDSKINFYGTNCTGYRPIPVSVPQRQPPYVPQRQPQYVPQRQPQYVPHRQPEYVPGPKPIGGCVGTRYECSQNNNMSKKY
jgi:hypothetical protein